MSIIRARGNAGINHDNQEPPTKAQVNFCVTMHHPLVSECNPDHVVKQDDTVRESRENWEFREFPDVGAITTDALKHEIKVSPLEFIEVKVDGIFGPYIEQFGSSNSISHPEYISGSHTE